ncbi:MAG: multiple sugar transport system permease protein [Thermomicrobiales bacterium]|jgi:ABC-type sugar transport system permease subunit|nr:multiple sugar transport system permease protein [Thermomicrobiales bacterium]MEA2525820.1 multiple sugar transport system permease protein [Thermomicrobiales bacterium]MEA2528828.1 multiple sugar transport system permease protein [Thermomicrobiales bacterium]MEA2582262.1 multiple sugar transport system permease protein [Thermomicrobiales bacterium]
MAVLAARRPTEQKRTRLSFAQRQALWGYLLVLPACLVLLGLVAYPFFYAIFISFTSRVVGDPGEWVGLANFRYLLKWSSFGKAVQNTIIMVVVSDILKLVLGLGLALILNEQFRGRGLFRSFILLPWAMPGFIAFLVWRLLYMPIGGGINLVLTETGIHTGIVDYLGERSTAMPAVIIATVWRGFPFWCISFLAALQTVPSELYEAAKIDGANAWQRFRAVTLPHIRQVILIVVLLSSIWTANSFENIWIMTQGGPSDATMVFPVLAYFGMQTLRLGQAAAVSVAMLPALAILVLVVTTLMKEED